MYHCHFIIILCQCIHKNVQSIQKLALERPRCSPRAGISRRMFVVAMAVAALEKRRIKYVGYVRGECFIQFRHREQQRFFGVTEKCKRSHFYQITLHDTK